MDTNPFSPSAVATYSFCEAPRLGQYECQLNATLWPWLVNLYMPPTSPFEVELWSAVHLHTLGNTKQIAGKILPGAGRRDELLKDGQFIVALKRRYISEVNQTLVRGAWICLSTGACGQNLAELYAYVNHRTYQQAIVALANEAKLLRPTGEIRPCNEVRDWCQEQDPLHPDFELWYAASQYPVDSIYQCYYNSSGHPIIQAIRLTSYNATVTSVYRSLWRNGNSSECQWAEVLPKPPYAVFNGHQLPFRPNCPVVMVQDEFIAAELGLVYSDCLFVTVPGGLKNVPRADLSALRGRRITIAFSRIDLEEGHRIDRALLKAGIADAQFSIDIKGAPKPFDDLEATASRMGIVLLPPPQDGEPEHTSSVITAAGERIAGGDEVRRILFDPIIAEGYLAWLYAEPKIGKTWLGLTMALAAAKGNRRVGRWFTSDPVGVLYVDGEMLPNELQQSIDMVMAGAGDPPGPAPFATICAQCQNDGVVDISSEEWQTTIETALRGKKLLILDNFQSVTDNGPGALNLVRPWLRKIMRSGIAILVLDHTNRDGDLQGSIAKERISNLVISLRYPDEDAKREGRFLVEYPRARRLHGADADPIQLRKRFTETTFCLELVESEAIKQMNLRPQLLKMATVVFAKDYEGLSYPKIHEAYSIAQATAHGYYKQAKMLIEDEKIAFDSQIRRLIAERGPHSSGTS